MNKNKIKLNKQSIGRITIYGILAIITLVILINPATYKNAIIRGVALYFNLVFPLVFPFLFISAIVLRLSNRSETNILPSQKDRLFHLPTSAWIIVLMSLIAGNPIGSKLTKDEYNHGRLSQKECLTLNCIVSACSPVFVIGVIGYSILGSTWIGLWLYFVHLLSNFLCAIIFAHFNKSSHEITQNDKITCHTTNDTVGLMRTCVQDAVTNALLIGGFIVLFYLFCEIIINCGIIAIIINLLPNHNTEYNLLFESILLSLVELTRGLSVVPTTIPTTILLPIISAIVAFNGVSIICQNIAFLSDSGIKLTKVILSRITSAIISYIVMSFVVYLIF